MVDFVADRRLSLPRERGSDPALWARLRAAARRVGVGSVFPDRVRGAIEDDHTPFAAAGLPAIDLIDFDYPPFHTRRDNLGAVSERSLDAAGEALVELLRTRDAVVPTRASRLGAEGGAPRGPASEVRGHPGDGSSSPALHDLRVAGLERESSVLMPSAANAAAAKPACPARSRCRRQKHVATIQVATISPTAPRCACSASP